MAQLFRKVFGPLLSRLEHADRHFGLGLLIADCVGTRVRMGFLYRKAISGVFDRPRLGITPVAPSPTLIITPGEVEVVRRKLPCAPCFAKAVPPRLHWRVPPVPPTCPQPPHLEDSDSPPEDHRPLLDLGDKAAGSPPSFKDILPSPSPKNPSLDLDLLQFSKALTDAFDTVSNHGSDAPRSVSSRSSFSPPHSSKASVGSATAEMGLEGEPRCPPTEPLTPPPPLPSSAPSKPPGLFASRSSRESAPSSLALSDTSDDFPPALRNPYNSRPERWADVVTSPFGNTYQIVGELGRGGYSSVKCALDDDGKVFALKTVHKGKAFRACDDMVRCLVLEQRCLRLGMEKEIDDWLRMVESWQDPLNAFFVLELAFGTLRCQFTNGHHRIEAKLWAREMLLSLKSLRDHHIVHSDIKPDNFLIVKGGPVVLSDFGLAQTPEPRLPTQAAFLEWRALAGGTPGYMAPEAIGEKPRYVTHGSDIFSLGVVFVELLGRMDGLLWDVYTVPPEHEDTRDVWRALDNGHRQQFLMDHHWLKYADIPAGSLERDLCEKMLKREASVDELLAHPYFDELFDDEGRLQHFHTQELKMSTLRMERENRDLSFEAWYRGEAGSYGPERPSFGPAMDGSKVIVSRWLKDNESTTRQFREPFPRDFDWVYRAPKST